MQKNTKKPDGKKPVNITLPEELYWKGKAHAANVRMPNISALLERLLAQELANPSITKKAA
jgi:post-segregation antitoxin (ccd killing protein)